MCALCRLQNSAVQNSNPKSQTCRRFLLVASLTIFKFHFQVSLSSPFPKFSLSLSSFTSIGFSLRLRFHSRVSAPPANAPPPPPMNRPHRNLLLHPNSHCQECGTSQSHCWILHHVRLKASFRRLCTNCVLKNNLSGFCPVCFDVYDDSSPPPSHQRVMCFRCPSISHFSCVSVHFSSTFLCSHCSDPRFTFFDGFHSAALSQSGSAAVLADNRVVDCKSARAIVAAARVAAQSMRRAAADARAAAETKIKNAAFAKKQATLALERLAFLVLQEEDRNGCVKSNNGDAVAGERTVEESKLQDKEVTAILERKKWNQSQ
ncbi:uncharacterized protein LOC111009209 [Momordica charantia]|uniref:Uncharacterized protein LOC111009209 n=1 Tax=Momordica charantia TaxID=3673 RepID=A0A6J1C9K9_MOMCH|nr:uncharacterized protein LOC111009209 [Momordica charantia]